MTEAERAEFRELVSSGSVDGLIPEWRPWWDEKALVEEVGDEASATVPSYIERSPKHVEVKWA